MPPKQPRERVASLSRCVARRLTIDKRRMLLTAALLLASFLGCRNGGSKRPAEVVSGELLCRTEHDLACVSPCQFVLPPDVFLEDGVSEDEAIATALSNNSAFQAMLMQIGMSQGDVVQAGLLTNPQLTNFIGVSVKQWEWTLYLPLEAFLVRPQRLAAAKSDYQRVANTIVQNGLTVVRDVRVAHADLAEAIAQWQLGQETIEIRRQFAELTKRRLDRGEISELESMTADVDALNAQASAALLEQNVIVARSRLIQLMGLPLINMPLTAELEEPARLPELDVAALTQAAVANRPDARAAEWAVQAAMQRARVARWQFLRIDLVADANQKGDNGYEVGPGVRMDVPVFNRNEGGVIRANAEVVQALHARDAIREQISQEIQAAAAQYVQAEASLGILEKQVVPSLDAARRIAEKSYAAGGAPYLFVLQANGQYIDARSRALTQIAGMRRALAELERGVGRSLWKLPPAPLPEQVPFEPPPLE